MHPMFKKALNRSVLFILLILSHLTSKSQSLTLQNASVQQISIVSEGTTHNRYFLLFGVKGNWKSIKSDSICIANRCFDISAPDSILILQEFIRGKKKSYMKLTIDAKNDIGSKWEGAKSKKGESIEAALYYHINSRQRILPITQLNQLPVKTE